MEYEIRNGLSSASILNGFGIIGLVVPVVAWVCCAISLSRTNHVLDIIEIEDNRVLYEKYFKPTTRIRSNSSILIVLSILSSIIWTAITLSR